MDARARIEEALHHLEHVLPGQAPIRDFVHHNTLHGYQHLPFPEAIKAAREVTGADAWLPPARCRQWLDEGRIAMADLDAALARHGGAGGDDVLARCGERAILRGDVRRAALLEDLTPVAATTLAWRLERGELDRERWAACCELLGLAPFPPAAATEIAAAPSWPALADRVGRDWTLRQLLLALTGEDALDQVRPTLVRLLAAHLDMGLAPWIHPHRGEGFYAAWRRCAAADPAWSLEALPDARREIGALPADAMETALQELSFLGLAEERWPGYLERLALELPGWSGMVLWRHTHAGCREGRGTPVAMVDYLAVRLVLERLATQAIVRRHWALPVAVPVLDRLGARIAAAELRVRSAAADDLPEHLAARAVRLQELAANGTPPDVADWEALDRDIAAAAPTTAAWRRAGREAWPLYGLAAALGIDAATLRAAGDEAARALLAELAAFDRDRAGHVWLAAYERNYRERIFAALAANHGRWHGHGATPSAQLVFCMDDREEGMRRHLEEIAPTVETLGAAAHFGVFQNYLGVDDEQVTPLCPVVPVVVKPAHEVREQARDAARLADHRERRQRRLAWKQRLHQGSRRGLFGAALVSTLAAPAAAAALAAKALAPSRFGPWVERLRRHAERDPATRLEFAAAAESGPATPEAPRLGFTPAEQAERIGGFLRNMGLTRDFAPLVVIMGHGSNSQNNPHLSAYDCGACAGRHSGPNARLFAAMANHPETRRLMAERGIAIPPGTWFLGAEHNTCDDGVTWYDTEDIPATLAPPFAELRRQLDAASRAHAQERCRRLASAPLGISAEAALRHVIGRRHDFSQARPELGHATNACAFIGRRSLSRGAFFDRRSFLISYDPTQDADGAILERLLLANGPVGAGIALEYYFSTVNNEQYGCGTKIVHNVTGLFAVMEGATSDLRTGLPRQMIEIHEAMRLLVVVEHRLDVITAIYQRQPALQELIGNGWIVVAAKDPDSPAIHLFDPEQGWLPWQGEAALPTVPASIDWFAGRREALPPALLERPLQGGRSA